MRIAHISDFHARRNVPGHPQIPKRRARQMPDLIARAMVDIRDREPDILAVTGDLIDAPFYGMQDPEMVDRITADLQLIREIIDPIGCPVLYLFGNHDSPKAFGNVFPDVNADTLLNGFRFVSFYDEEIRDNAAERLGEQRKRFDRVLDDADNTPQIHLQHYMIWPENNEGYPHSYREARELKSRITASGKVTLSLSGHFHGGVDTFDADGTWFATSRAFCEHPHPYRIYDITDEQVLQTDYTIESPDTGCALFLDMGCLVTDVSDLTELTAALTEIRGREWALIGVSDPAGREPQEFEVQNDILVEALLQAGCELDAVVCRRSAHTSASAPYHIAQTDLGVNLEASRALTGSATEASAARSAGIRAAHTRPDLAVSALQRLVP